MAEDTQGTVFDTGGVSNPFDSAPSYVRAADNHNIASGNSSMEDYLKGGIGALGGAVAGAAIGQAFIPIPFVGAALGAVGGAVFGAKTLASDGKFAAASIVSGWSDFYNSEVALNNWMGGHQTKMNTLETLSSWDSDLGAYYAKNRESADITGFVVGSLLPVADSLVVYNWGAKALNAAKYGKLGSNFSDATGLLGPLQAKYLDQAVKEMSGASIFEMTNKNMIKAFATGVAEEAIQGAVSSTAILATMHASPILEGQDAKDMAWNVLSGALFQGVAGGVFRGAKSYGYAKKGIQAAEIDAKPQMYVGELRENSAPIHHILNWMEERVRVQGEAVGTENVTYKERLKDETTRKLYDRTTEKVKEIALGDGDTGEGLANIINSWNEPEDAASRLVGLKTASRVKELSDFEKIIARARKNIAGDKGTDEERVIVDNSSIKYLRLHGEGMGDFLDGPPVTLNLADTLKPGQRVEVFPNRVRAGTENYNFTLKPENEWDMIKEGQKATEARHIWAINPSGAKMTDGMIINENDIPLLSAAYTRGIKGVQVRSAADKSLSIMADKDSLLNTLQVSRQRMRDRLVAASQANEFVTDPDLVEQKLKQALGVHWSYSEKVPDAIAWTYRGDSKQFRDIYLNTNAVKSGRYTLADLAGSILHEQGHNFWNLITDITMGAEHDIINEAANPERLRGITREMVNMSKLARTQQWRANQNEFIQSMGMTRGQYLNQATELAADSFSWLALHPQDVDKYPKFYDLTKGAIKTVPQEIIDSLKVRAQKLSTEEIAKMLNVKLGYLEGTGVDEQNPVSDLFAMQSGAREYTDMMVKAGRWNKPSETIPVYLRPQTAKLVIDTTPVRDMDGNVMKGMAVIKAQQRLFQGNADRAVASVVGEDLYGGFQTFDERQSSQASRMGTGNAKELTAGDAPYGSFGSMIQQIGSTTHRISKALTDSASTAMTPALYGITGDIKAAVEAEAMNTALRQTPESYYFDPARGEFGSMVLRRIKVNEELMAAGQKPQLADSRDVNAPEVIPFGAQKAADLWASHVEQNGATISKHNSLVAANGLQPKLDPRVAYPIPVDQKRYPFFAYVVDPTFNETGHVHMIYAASENELDKQISDVKRLTNFDVTGKNNELKVLTKAEVERFKKASDEYSREDTITENYVRNELLRKGVSSNYIPPTDPEKIADNFLRFHLDKSRQLARYATVTKYSKEFAELRTQGESFTNLATSKVGMSSMVKWAENQVSNPFADYVKTALDITNLNEIPRWTAVNNYLDAKLSNVWEKVSSLWGQSKSPEDLDYINDTFKKYGLNTAHYDAATVAHANHEATDGAFTKFVARANGVMATLLLRMDPLNAANNMFGSPILTGTEFKSVTDLIKRGPTDGINKLAELANITVPGTGDSILSPTKLYGGAIRAFFNNPEARDWAFKQGFTTRHLMEVDGLIGDAAMTGKETDEQLAGKGMQLYKRFMAMGDWAEKWTGNKLAEEFNRFTAAYGMKQVTDIAVQNGLLKPENALSYINTFVNRTQGNYLASQRPLMFQGPIGNAIGLFQTYQFNLAQQLLRHVAEGSTKDAALALGLQTAVYGMNGLPGFQQINAHLIGTASGNQNHRDLYDATYGAAGKDIGNWLMYGTASNAMGFLHPDLKMNLYSRGDINPRQPTILPTSLSEVPIVGAFAKFATSLKDSVSKMANGGDAWPTILQGIEHSGINRPLAGLAQTLEALGDPGHQSYSTSTKGNVIAANDLFSFANLTRITGGRPLDEAIAVDSGYRLDAYKTKDSEQRDRLGQAIKTAVIAGGVPSADQMDKFADHYARIGGQQENFNKFYMGVLKRANTSQVNTIAENLKSPYSVSMQRILGGYEMNDFNH